MEQIERFRVVSNIGAIRDMLHWPDRDSFYLASVIQRKKDGPSVVPGNNAVIKHFYLESLEDFDKQVPVMLDLCHAFNARAYICLGIRSKKDVALKMMALLAERISHGDYNAKSLYSSAAGLTPVRKDRRLWVVDFDAGDPFGFYEQTLKTVIEKCRPYGPKVIATFDTAKGKHLISKPFDTREFHLQLALGDGASDFVNKNTTLHKENPTLLYFREKLP